MNVNRVVAVALFAVAFVALSLTYAFPFLDDLPGVAEAAIAIGGAACILTGASLWFRKTGDTSG